MHFLSFLASLSLLALAQLSEAQAPIKYDIIHNYTSISGTWSSGAKNVVTGAGFVNPLSFSFTYPKTTGISYSFTDDGYFEEALYRFQGNGTKPSCIQGIMQWQHGTYQLLPNGSIVLDPFAPDGRIQVQDTCAPVTNVLVQFNQTTLFQSWRIFHDLTDGPKLHLFRFDGMPFAPMFQVSKTPIMMDTKLLTNITSATADGA